MQSESENQVGEESESENSADDSSNEIKPESIILEKENNIKVIPIDDEIVDLPSCWS